MNVFSRSQKVMIGLLVGLTCGVILFQVVGSTFVYQSGALWGQSAKNACDVDQICCADINDSPAAIDAFCTVACCDCSTNNKSRVVIACETGSSCLNEFLGECIPSNGDICVCFEDTCNPQGCVVPTDCWDGECVNGSCKTCRFDCECETNTCVFGSSSSSSISSVDRCPLMLCPTGCTCKDSVCCPGSSSSSESSLATGQCLTVCGDGLQTGGEGCDDGNQNTGDGCDESCIVEECGNKIIQSGEECDDGNTASGDGCSAVCNIEVSVCGNGICEFDEAEGICPPCAMQDLNNFTNWCALKDSCACSLGCEQDCGCPAGSDCTNTQVCTARGGTCLNVGPQVSCPKSGSSCCCEVPPFCGDCIVDPGEQCDVGSFCESSGWPPGALCSSEAACFNWGPCTWRQQANPVCLPDCTIATSSLSSVSISSTTSLLASVSSTSTSEDLCLAMFCPCGCENGECTTCSSASSTSEDLCLAMFCPCGCTNSQCLTCSSSVQSSEEPASSEASSIATFATNSSTENSQATLCISDSDCGSVSCETCTFVNLTTCASACTAQSCENNFCITVTGLIACNSNDCNANTPPSPPPSPTGSYCCEDGICSNLTLCSSPHKSLADCLSACALGNTGNSEVGSGPGAGLLTIELSSSSIVNAPGSPGPTVSESSSSAFSSSEESSPPSSSSISSSLSTVPGPNAPSPGPGGNSGPFCGDGFINQSFEDCDDGNTSSGDGCSSICSIESTRGGSSVPAGQNTPPIVLLVAPLCGNGQVEGAEMCDDGNTNDGDGCSSICVLETIQANGAVLFCGDGFENQSFEQCDDRNTQSGDGCSSRCTIEGARGLGISISTNRPAPYVILAIPECGNAVIEDTETCDDGNTEDGDGCSSSCQKETQVISTALLCGNSVLDPGEQCEDGNPIDGDGCSSLCRVEVKKIVAAAVLCGNGLLEFPEECDDSNIRDSDGCSSTCLQEVGICGDGFVQSLLGEQCEASTHDSQSPYECVQCRFSSDSCGDGIVDPGEECDAGENNSNEPDSECRLDCGKPRCGDGILDSSEECDDGNKLRNDGCDRFCAIEENDGEETLVAGEFLENTGSRDIRFPFGKQENGTLPLGASAVQRYQAPSLQPLPMQLPLAQLAAYSNGRAPAGDTGPAVVVVISAGAGAGIAWVRRKRKK